MLASLTVAAFVTAPAQAEPAALQVPGEVQLTTLTGSGLAHTIRHAGGAWDRFGFVPPPSSAPVTRLVSAIVAGEEHVLYDYQWNGHPPHFSYLQHHIRHADGSWTSTAPGFLGRTADAAAAAVSGELHLVRRSAYDDMQHHVRHSDGTWSALPGLPLPAAQTSMGLAGYDGESRLLVGDPTAGTLTYRVAQADGVWSAGVDVPFAPSAQGVQPSAVDIAQVGSELHAVVQGTDGLLYHSARHSGGTWDAFHGIGTQIPVPAGAIQEVSITAASNQLHVAIAVDGGLHHAIRLATGFWQPFGDVEGEAGAVSSTNVAIAGS